jgi:hypothetical protein
MGKGVKMYVVYDMKNQEQCMGVFDNRKELAKFFNTTPNSIGAMICRKQKFERRYLIEKVEE